MMAKEDILLDELRKELQTEKLEPLGGGGGGCIGFGQGYVTDQGQVFVKQNRRPGERKKEICNTVSAFGEKPGMARLMFDGEAASLTAIRKTNTIRVPEPIKVLDCESGGRGAVLVMEYLHMRTLQRHSAVLGEQLARLHLYNDLLRQKIVAQESSIHRDESLTYVDKFGFDVTTCCGFIPQDNTWESDWVTFLVRRKLGQQLDLIEKQFGDREAGTLWSELQLKLASIFGGGATVRPALLHGDLWSGNVAETEAGPVVFDAASFYGDSEYEMTVLNIFGGFEQSFFDSYHKLIPRAENGHHRARLYQLYNRLNHWNHFGSKYRDLSLDIMRELVKQ